MPSASELRDAFAKFDANGDGYLSVEELVGVFTRPVGDGQPMTEAPLSATSLMTSEALAVASSASKRSLHIARPRQQL